jgi:hypothetical protein
MTRKPTSRFRNRRHLFECLESRQLMDGDPILEWNAVMLEANAVDHAQTAPEQGGPILTSRAFAIVSAAMYDAYNSIERIGEPYLVTAKRGRGANVDAAVAQAAHDTLVALYPSQASVFDAALTAALDDIVDGYGENQGKRIGKEVARRILAARADDGRSSLEDPNYQPMDEIGFHDVDPLHPLQGFYGSGAMAIDSFVVPDLDPFTARRLDDGTVEGRLAYLQSDEYTAAYQEVLALGGDGTTTPTERSDEQTEIGIYWAYDGRPGLGTPPRLYNQIVREIVEQEGNTTAENARLFALVNLAMADAGLAAWKNKYEDDFWRPILGIREGADDGNPETLGDAEFIPLGAPASNPRPGETNFTPPFPAYVSGHATFGAAMFEMVENFYGRDDLTFSFVSDEFNGITRGTDGSVRPLVERTYSSLTEAKVENAVSRIYLGIHWRMDADEGIAIGDEVADAVFATALRPERRTVHRPYRHNAFDPEDVNDDAKISPMDALAIINAINARRTDSINYLDVNDDGECTPVDVLMVINRLNRQPQAAGSGAGRPEPTAATAALAREFRALDGTGNHLEENRERGLAGLKVSLRDDAAPLG